MRWQGEGAGGGAGGAGEGVKGVGGEAEGSNPQCVYKVAAAEGEPAWVGGWGVI